MEYKIEDKALIERLKQKIAANKFSKHIKLQYDSVEVGKTKAHIDIEEFHHQQNGYAHGGLLATLCDIAAGFAAYSVIPIDRQVVTGEIKTSYFRAGKAKRLFVEGWVVKPGRRVVFCEAEVYYLDDKQKRKTVVKSNTTMIVIGEDF